MRVPGIVRGRLEATASVASEKEAFDSYLLIILI